MTWRAADELPGQAGCFDAADNACTPSADGRPQRLLDETLQSCLHLPDAATLADIAVNGPAMQGRSGVHCRHGKPAPIEGARRITHQNADAPLSLNPFKAAPVAHA